MKLLNILLILLVFSRLTGAVPCKIVQTISDDFSFPSDIAVDSKGNIFVADGVNQRVLMYFDGILQTTITHEQMIRPMGLFIDDKDFLYITDTDSKSVFIFNEKQKFIRKINLPENSKPVDVIVVKDHFYFSDNNNHQIIHFSKEDEIFNVFGTKGTDDGEFMYPATLTADDSNRLYVVDVLNGRIQVFDFEGVQLGQFGQFGIMKGDLYRPKGVAVNSENKLFVTDSYTGTIQMFSTEIQTTDILTNSDGMPLNFNNPTGICFDNDGMLWVVVSAENKIIGLEILSK